MENAKLYCETALRFGVTREVRISRGIGPWRLHPDASAAPYRKRILFPAICEALRRYGMVRYNADVHFLKGMQINPHPLLFIGERPGFPGRSPSPEGGTS